PLHLMYWPPPRPTSYYAAHVETAAEVFSRRAPRGCDRDRDFSCKRYLVPALEPERLLRKGVCRNGFSRTGAAIHPRVCRAIRNHFAQWQTKRRVTRSSTGADRPVEERSRAAP